MSCLLYAYCFLENPARHFLRRRGNLTKLAREWNPNYERLCMLINVLMASLIIALIAFVVVLKKHLNSREDRKMRGLFGGWPIKQVGAEDIDPCFAVGKLGVSRDTEIRFFAGYRVEGGISDMETWILCNLAKRAKHIFEIGTCTGKTTFLMAANSPADARVTTITLKPEQAEVYKAQAGDADDAQVSAINESQFTEFVYSNTPEEKKIIQLYGDSKEFDETPYVGTCDLVFVDGSHARSYVESDSQKALRMVRTGGIIVWHDYRGPRRAKGVFQALNALSKTIPLRHVIGTCFVVYKKP